MNFFSRFQKNFTKKYFLLSLFSIIFAGSLLFASDVFAQATTNFGLGKVGSLLPLGGEDIWVIVGKIIRIFLSLLGIIAVGLIMYAGFLWTTSAGNEEKISSAKKILINATIGLAIILGSLAITQFILSSLVDATGGTMGEDVGPGGRGGAGLGGGSGTIHECGDEDFVVKSLTPKTPQDNGTGMTNVVVRAVFSRPLDPDQDLKKVLSVSSSNGIISPKVVRIQEGRQIVEAIFDKTTALCLGGQTGCLSEGSYVTTVNPELIAGGLTLKTRLSCGEFDNTANFSVNKDFLDQISPLVPSFTFDGKNADQRPLLPRGKSYLLNATFQDRRQLDGGTFFGGMSYLHVKVEGDVMDPAKSDILRNYFTGPRSGSNESFVFSQNVDFDASSSIPALYTFTLTGGDIDSNSVIATSSFILDGELCHNGRLDPGETAIDIGGDCLGNGRCSAGWQCLSGVCENGMCVNSPVIYNVDVGGLNPEAWKSSAGSWVTIVGHFFGEDEGRVEFGRDTNNDGTADDWRRAILANCNGLDMWRDTSIVVEVPDIPVDSSTTIRVVTLAHGQTPEYTDLSNDNKGPKPGPNSGIFVINNEVHPGLCAVVNADNLSVGTSTQDITAYGRDLGRGANSALLFGGLTAKIRNWGDLAIRSNVPQNFQAGTVGVKAKVGDTFTNGVQFSVVSLSDTTAPIIASVTSSSTTAGSLITLVGTTFGESGTVYLSNNRQSALACALAGAPGAECKVLNLVDLPRLCGNTWSDTQIIGKIPEDIALGDIYIVVRNNLGNFSDGTSLITIKNGDPRPGLCRLIPDKGIAPLAEDANPLQLIGTNLNPDPVLYYWALGASSTNILTNWLNSDDNTDPSLHNPIRSVSADGTEIRTTLPFSQTGTSMITGPIRAKVGNFETNDIRYTVDDCTKSPSSTPGDDYQCCTEGDEAGSWKPSGYACLGQTRDAGYVWRFTTGFIPQVPYVLEACSVEDWNDLQKENFDRPSPSPSVDWKTGNACINSLITAQFNIPMGVDNVAQNVRVYTCGQGNSPDCVYDEPHNVSSHYTPLFLAGNSSILELRFNAPNFSAHATSTWHRVLLGGDLHAQVAEGFNFNQVQINTQKFAVQKPIKGSIAGFPPVSYYFDFKTGEQTCTLIGAGIAPPDYTARLLGMLQEPGKAISENLDNPPFPYYYYVWGRGNQQCSVIDVNGMGWSWKPQQQGAQFAYASKSDNMGVPVTSSAYASDIRATVTALQNTDVTPVPITASIDRLVEGVERRITGTSTLTVDLGDPKIIRKWPDCNQSCVNVNIGVDFSRHMATSTYRINRVSGIRVQECRDLGENCNVLDPAGVGSIVTEDINADSFSPMRYEVTIPGQLKLNQLYKVTVTDQIKSLGRYSAGSVVFGPSLIPPTSWKFRTKLQDGICKIEQVDVLPDPFYATLVGQKTVYNASALSSPNQCNSEGQRLNPWLYGWEWSIANPLVATTTHFASKGNPKAFCTQGCKPAGSDFLRGATNYLCGNAVIDPGEDCDIMAPGNQEIAGVTCSLSCLRPGNKNSTNTTTPAEAVIGKCGNGVVENPSNPEAGRRTFGEECDPGIPEMRDFCTSDCLWKGTDSNFSDAVGALQCGNGSIGLLGNNGGTLGEECDLGITLQKATVNNHVNWAGVGCSDKCLHTGTQLSRSYCEGLASDQSEIKNSVDCQNSVSVCGNGALEPGEECEIADIQNNVILIPSLENGVDVPRGIVVASSSAVCSNSCLLKTACDEDDVDNDASIAPNRDPNFNGHGFPISSHYKCAAGTPGCSDTCTFLGSSPLYETASLCGDGVTGIGENSLCENDSVVAPIGENPLQIVEALGQGVVDLQTNSQNTLIKAEAKKIRTAALIGEEIPGHVSGTAQYNLQCGYVEYSEAKIEDQILRLNNCDDPTFGVANNSCCVPRPHVTQSYPIHGAGIIPDPATHDVGPVCLNTYIEATFDTLLSEEEIAGKVTIAHTLPAGVAACQNGEANVTDLAQSFLALNDNNVNNLPILARFWQHIKEFFIAMFQSVVHAVGPLAEDVDHQIIDTIEAELGVNPIWCAGRVVPTLSHFEKREGEENPYSAVSIKINQLLATDTFYAVILSGGNAGFKNLQGVGIQGKAYLDDATKFNKDDMFIFKTGEELCRIKEITATPNNYLYTSPRESADYHADAISTNGQRIVGTPGYMWVWGWQPQSTALFTYAAPTTTENITIASTDLEGKLLVSAQATVTEDTSNEGNQLRNIFSGMIELTSMFCQNPWPSRETYPYEDKDGNRDNFDWNAKSFNGSPILPVDVHNNPEYFNFSFGYCADSGDASNFEDDLPRLRPKVEGHLRAFHTEDRCINVPAAAGGQMRVCNKVRVFDQVIDTGDLPADTFKKFLFFNDKNDDLVGIQIFENPDRKSIREWYTTKNLGAVEMYNDIEIDGYKGITDGNNYYINALNELSDKSVKNYVYLFSINVNAQENTREVFQKLITSLLFNINISQRESCLQGQSVDAQSRVLPLKLGNAAVVDIACQDDFACRKASGAPLEGTIGICANAKTKFQNDWKRLNAIQTIQAQIENSRTAKGVYPQLLAGTYIPGYTNKHWPSWNVLTEEIGNTPAVPLDTWSACGVCQNQESGKNVGCNVNTDCAGLGDICNLPDDMRSCWRSANTSFACPAISSVLEYKTTGPNDYHIYLPLEYFNNAEIPAQRAIISEFVSTTHYSDVSSCGAAGLEIKNAEAGACGDGIVNAQEECDPVGTMSPYSCVGENCLVTCVPGQTAYHTCNNTCHYDAPVCRQNLICGNGRVDAGETCDDGLANGTYNHCSLNCDYLINAFCGNGTRDWYDRPNAGVVGEQDGDEAYLEFCEKNEMIPGGGSGAAPVLKFGLQGYCARDRQKMCSDGIFGVVNSCVVRSGQVDIDYGPCLSMQDPTYSIFEKLSGDVENYTSCAADCQGPGGFCGDGKLQVPDEECDDNNKVSLDGCSKVCQKENLACAQSIPSQNISFDTGVNGAGLQRNHTVISLNYSAATTESCLGTSGDAICRGFGINTCFAVSKLVDGDWVPKRCSDILDAGINALVSIRCQGPRNDTPVNVDPVVESGSCGNSIHDPGEECDMGNSAVNGNGVVCTPTYGTACTYCAADCSRVFTVDPTRACGNGKIDVINEDPLHPVVEQCDVDPASKHVMVIPVTFLPEAMMEYGEDFVGLYRSVQDNSEERTCTARDNRVATGTVSCKDDCRVLDLSNCVECGSYENEGKSTPKLSVLNVLTPNSRNTDWGISSNSYHYIKDGATLEGTGLPQFHRDLFLNKKLDAWQNSMICQSNAWGNASTRLVFSSSVNCSGDLRFSEQSCKEKHRLYEQQVDQRTYSLNQWMCSDSNYYPLDFGYGYKKITNLNVNEEANWTWGNYTETIRQIESSSMCNGESGYSVYFGLRGIQEKRGEQYGYQLKPNSSPGDTKNWLAAYGDFFPYPVNGEGNEIKNEYVVSPAVPPATFRVVVKWKTNDANVRFTGLVYNSQFNDHGVDGTSAGRFRSRVDYFTALGIGRSHICDVMEKVGDYWWPMDCDSSSNLGAHLGGVYMHHWGALEKIAASSMTILTKNIFGVGETAYNAPYAFFVQAITANNNETNISALENLDVSVDVYEYHEGQVPEYSMYLPTATYTMRLASKSSNTGTDALVKYWHVFNLEKVGDAYQIKKPIDLDTQRTYDNGILVTDFADVLCRVPGPFAICNRDE